MMMLDYVYFDSENVVVEEVDADGMDEALELPYTKVDMCTIRI